MKAPGRTKSRKGRLAGVAAALLLAACVADDQQTASRQDVTEVATVQPRQATYDCGADGKILVENMRTAVRLVESEGESYDLPASPPAQTMRYGEGGLALVVDGRDALWMKAGHEPVTCRR